jgi:two-component system, LytTR family, sensor kinase
MQLLVENAIKHNEISDEFPLKIRIYSQNNILFVTNLLKRKNTDEYSTGIGLHNLKERYMQFSDLIPEFYVENGYYVAQVSLLEDE